LICEKYFPAIAFICILLINNEIENLHIYLLAVYFSSSVNGTQFGIFDNESVLAKNCQQCLSCESRCWSPMFSSNISLWCFYHSQEDNAYLKKCWLYFRPSRERSVSSTGILLLTFYHFLTFGICLLISAFSFLICIMKNLWKETDMLPSAFKF
jgi:hypothetical protein